MTIARLRSIFLATLLPAIPAGAGELPFERVRQSVEKRTGETVRWEQDMAAREESQSRVHALLRKPLTAGRAVQVALLGNRELQAAFEEIGLSYADLRQARTLANPEVDLAVKFPDRAPKAAMYEWGIAQNFLDLLMLPLRTRVAKEQLAAAQFRASGAVVRLVGEVKAAFIELQADAALAGRLRIIFESQAASLELMQKLHAAGNVTDLKLSREQAAYDRVRLEMARAGAETREHREKLNRLLGLWGRDTAWTISGELPPVPDREPTVKGLETLAVANRLDLAAARAELESRVKSLGLEKKFRFFGALDFGAVGEHDPDGANLTGPSARLEIPVFHQGQARIARGEAGLRMAQRKFEQLAIDIRSEVRELRDRLISKRDIARFHREELLPTQLRIVSLTLLEYNAMLTGAFELFEVKREAIETERASITAARDYWVTRAALEAAVGGDLDASPRPLPSKKSTTH